MLNAIPSAVILEQISVFQGCDLAQGPKIELLPIEPDDLACDLLEAIHAGTLLLSNGGIPGRARALLLELTIPANRHRTSEISLRPQARGTAALSLSRALLLC